MSEADAGGDDRIIDPEIRRFVDYWRAKRGAASS